MFFSDTGDPCSLPHFGAMVHCIPVITGASVEKSSALPCLDYVVHYMNNQIGHFIKTMKFWSFRAKGSFHVRNKGLLQIL